MAGNYYIPIALEQRVRQVAKKRFFYHRDTEDTKRARDKDTRRIIAIQPCRGQAQML